MATTDTRQQTPSSTGRLLADPVVSPTADPAVFHRDAWSGTDMDEARRQLEAALDGRGFRARPGPAAFSFRFASAGDGRLSLQTGTFQGHIQGVIPWSRDYVVSWFQVGSVTIDYPRGQLTSVGDRPFLTPTETSYSFSMTPHRHGIVHIDATFLEDVAAQRDGRPSQRVVFDYHAVPTGEGLAGWRRALGETTPIIVSPETSAVDVAAAVDMHPRSQQQQKCDHHGTSPTAYIRHVRLDRARQDLLAAAPGDVLVSDVARRWGFANLGRFSAAYAERFGEYPRDTLAR